MNAIFTGILFYPLIKLEPILACFLFKRQAMGLYVRVCHLVFAFLALWGGCNVLLGCSMDSSKHPLKGENRLVTEIGDDIRILDPSLATDSVTFRVLTNVYEGLTRIGPQNRIVEGMAETIEVSKDKRTYTFYLREASWSDDVPVRADDFVFALKRIMDPKTAAQYAYIVTETLKDVVALNDRTLKVTLKRPTPYFLWLTAFPSYYPLRHDWLEKLGAAYGTSPDLAVYNGPFVVENWRKGSRVTLHKNPRYWDEGSVFLKRADFVIVKDSNTLVQMFDGGAMNLMYQVPTVHLPRYKENPFLKPRPEAVTDYIILNLHHPKLKPLLNPKVRRALSLALDRQAYCSNVDRQSLPAYALVPPAISADMPSHSFRAHFGDRFKTFYDPMTQESYKTSVWFEDNEIEQARRLFKEGLEESGQECLSFSLMIDDSLQARRLGQVLKFFWEKRLGVRVRLEPVTYQSRLAKVAMKDFELANVLWGADYDDPMTFLDLFTTGSPFNDPGFSNPAYDLLIQKARDSQNPKGRMGLFVQAERLLMEESPIIPVFYRFSYTLAAPWIKGLVFLACGADNPLKWVRLNP
jgi:oligopeptide transport system substrate-binding protein